MMTKERKCVVLERSRLLGAASEWECNSLATRNDYIVVQSVDTSTTWWHDQCALTLNVNSR